MNCVIYARVSSKEQEKEGNSIPAQMRLLKEYAEKNNLKIMKEFIDVETAKQSGRTKFGEMIACLNRHISIRIILVEKTDRLYRNFKDYVMLEDMDLEIHLVKENEIISKISRSHAKFIHGIQVLMAKNFIDNLSEEVKKGMQEKALNGDYPSRGPLGYKNNLTTHKIEIDPDKALLVKKLFEWYATGQYSLKTVSEKAYKEGLGYRKSGQPFSAGTMEKILKNPIYYGVFRWNGKLFENGNHEPIISKQLFDLVQTQLKRFDKPKKAKLSFAFRGLLTCGYCGCQMTAQGQADRYIYYNCTGARGKCEQKYIREEIVGKKLGEVIKNITLDPELVDWIKEALKSSHSDENEFHKRVVAGFKRDLSKLENRLSVIYEDKIDGHISTEQWEKLHQKYTGEIEVIRRQLDRHMTANIDYYETGVKILELAKGAYSQYVSQNNDEKRKLLNFVVSKCIVRGDEFMPIYRQPFDMLAVYKKEEVQKKHDLGDENQIHQLWRPQGDSNPCCRRERAVS